MYIKSIELDGFKSYSKNTLISGFSPRFNAITGYNGSGKSNVLDSICFLLGITKLDAVRAKNMSELIAHGGTKASVEIRFDNTNKAQSPFGMENFDEIVVVRTIVSNGRICNTNYYLNGHAAPNSRMADLFRGIGLNVNNPHFLIMQGRITTVLNMKPEEILGMVEEAAGTKMYDSKKKEAEKTMFLKEVKLKEVDFIFDGSIDPRMEKFREDRKNMIEVTRLQKIKENASRKAIAFDYYQALERSKADTVNLEKAREKLVENGQSIERLKEQTKRKEEEKAELEKERDQPKHEHSLNDEQKAAQDVLLIYEQERRAIVEDIEKLEREIKLTEKALKADEIQYREKQAELERVKQDNSVEVGEVAESDARIKHLRDELETITRGTIANDKGEQVSLESAIQDTRSAAAMLETTVKTSENRKKRVQAQINIVKEKSAGLAAKRQKNEEALDKLKKDAELLTEEINSLDFDVDTDTTRRNRYHEISNRLKELRNKNDHILERVCGGRFALSLVTPPNSNFDEERDVDGLLVHLVKLKPQFREYHQAVDIALGGLYGNIVVRNQDVARILIEGKAFTGRRTCIPVSENGRTGKSPLLPDHVIHAAQRIADRYNEHVLRLIDMVEFPAKIDNTFRSALGSILVVQTLECAREVAFADGVKTRVLTGRGDDVKTTGVMSGGATEKGDQHIITALEGIHEQLDEIAVLREEQRGHAQYLREVEDKYQKFLDVNKRLVEAEKKLAIYQNNVKTSDVGRAELELETLAEEAKQIELEIEDANGKLIALKKKIESLESRKTNDKSELEKRKISLNKELKQLEKYVDDKRSAAGAARANILMLEALVTSLQNSIKEEEDAKKQKNDQIAELRLRIPAAEQKCQEGKDAVKAVQAKVQLHRNEQRNVVDRISRLTKDMTNLRREEIRLNTAKDEIDREIVRLTESAIENKKYASQQAKKNEWVVDEQAHFNKKGGLYDFEGYSSSRGNAELKELTEKIEKMERSLCMKNVANLDSCEAKVIDIRNKREKLHEDFNILKKTISILDVKKTDELERAHESVNRDFGKIFNCLLPDATATLVPPPGKTVSQGLEVKVAFNGVVKESLHELSGGQRSLVALSLILAMLKFKPAPLYILDEVDAALDLSHTANIGKMIKEHFSDNQFIIVSLKQGMFSNAECLFQTNFADGYSRCEQLTGAALEKARNDAKLAEQADELAEAAKAPKKPVKKASRKPARSANDEVDEMA